MCLLDLCAGDDKADEDVDGSWCVDLGDNVHNLGEFILLVVFVLIGDGSGEGNMIFFFILVVMVSAVIRVIMTSVSFLMKVFCFLVIFSKTLAINLSQNHHFFFILGAFDVANKKLAYLLNPLKKDDVYN